jgi:hypothetical protein
MDSMSTDAETGQAQHAKGALDRFNSLLAAYGINLGSNVVVGGNPAQTYKSPVNIMPSVTEEGARMLCISGGALRPVLAYAGTIDITPGAAGVTPLLQTDASCRTVPAQEPFSLENASESTGAYTVGAVAQKGETAIAVFASSSFVTSEADYAYKGNSDMFLNTLKFLSSGQAAASIPVKKLYDGSDPAYRLSVEPDMKALLMAGAAGAPALAVFLAGLSRWAKRRKL